MPSRPGCSTIDGRRCTHTQLLEARLDPAHPATITLPSGLTKSTLPGHPTDADLVGEERSVV
jgi:hypothetical protein